MIVTPKSGITIDGGNKGANRTNAPDIILKVSASPTTLQVGHVFSDREIKLMGFLMGENRIHRLDVLVTVC